MQKKAQAWYADFAIGLLLFFFTLVIYIGYTDNFQKQDEGELGNMLTDARALSSSLILSGYPNDWNSSTVVRIGVSDDQRLNATKLQLFSALNYTLTKRKFATPYDYFVFFANDKGDILNIYGVCGVGNPLVNITYDIKSAYYYQDPADSFFKNFMNQTFKADIYFGDNQQDNDDIDSLIANLSKYGFLVMEHPNFPTSVYNNFKDEIEYYTSKGGYFMISGELTSAQGRELVGADFYKKSGQSASDRNSTVNNTDPYLALNVGENIIFRQAYYAVNTSAVSQFKQIATFNQDQNNAVSKWKYGNGTVYFFSDFDVTYFNGNFTKVIEDVAKALIEGTCTDLNLTNLKQNKLVKTERYLSYNSRIIKMLVYVWQ